MQTWKWLYNPDQPYNWRFFLNVVARAVILFIGANLAFIVLNPLPALGQLSAYNVVLEGRERLPYGDNPSVAYNLSLFNIEAMFASLKLDDAVKPQDEFRVLVMGDSSVWGILLKPEDTLVGQLNQAQLSTTDGRVIRAYNLGYPTMSLTKDLMLLDYAMRYDPDLIVWLFTLKSFPPGDQLASALVQHNPDRIRNLIKEFALEQNLEDSRFVETDTREKTIVGQRRALADLLRLQLYGVPWTTTGIDQAYPDDYTRVSIDLEPDSIWQGRESGPLTSDDLAFDVLQAGVTRAQVTDVPVLFINEPIFISSGANSDIRYNAFYPIWAYDDYRHLLHQQSDKLAWQFCDLWNMLPDEACYTDSPVHLTPECAQRLSLVVGGAILDMASTGSVDAREACTRIE